MPAEPIRFEDGAAYEQAMGVWSAIAGRQFLRWVSPKPGLRWLDVGCGNGAFTELILSETRPAEVQGIDPSEGQLSYARTRPGAAAASFQQGSATELPFEPDRFDAAVMALVIFFVPEPAVGVSEMVRVVRPGGLVTAYAWDILGGGFPFEPLQAELRARGGTPSLPPRAEASRVDALRALWSGAGLAEIEQRPLEVERRFGDFERFWSASTAISSMRGTFANMPAAELADFKAGVRRRVTVANDGAIVLRARANAIKGVRR